MTKNYCNPKAAAILRRAVKSAEEHGKFDMLRVFYPCDSPSCLYGEIITSKKIIVGRLSFEVAVNRVLGIDEENANLYNLYNWSGQNQNKYLSAKTQRGRIAALRSEVEIFIKTGGMKA